MRSCNNCVAIFQPSLTRLQIGHKFSDLKDRQICAKPLTVWHLGDCQLTSIPEQENVEWGARRDGNPAKA